MTGSDNAAAWGLPGVLDFFADERNTSDKVYPSEWFFLHQHLREGITVLDVGCAQGGFAAVLGEHLADFAYTGVDINAAMVDRARAAHPDHRFLVTGEGDLSPLEDQTFDLVLVLGILHLHEAWRDTLAAAWARTAGALIFDLRETDGPTVEDRTRAWFRMDFAGGGGEHGETILPYNLINAGEALAEARRLCPGAANLSRYGYLHAPRGSAVLPVDQVLAETWCAER
ncbi:MAG: class I SAM-dependent methyltransferase [Hyphomicrobiales bacterium]|nr:class I SAM-dependent methyltransferase [Hyphomicrobiales bacterium]MCP5370526.1 class I SAM-dependent methyltransferase [Hyphomicrobiales bacterium]